MSQTKRYCGWKIVLLGLALGGCLGLTGCMGNYSGQNLPSAVLFELASAVLSAG